MSDIKISIIVPVYNVEDYLRECLDSILNQDFNDFELILVDDGSTDNSGQICDDYCCKRKNIKVFHIKNCGQASARNFGFTQSVGEYICYVDSDDIIHPQLLSSLLSCFKDNDTKIAMCSAESGEVISSDFYNNKEAIFIKRNVDEDFFNSMIDSDWETQGIKLDVIWGKLIHREIIQQFPFADGRIYEDTAVICSWLDASKTVYDSSTQLYFYRKRENSTISSSFSRRKLDQLWADEEIESFYRKRNYDRMIAYSTLAFCQHSISIEHELARCSELDLQKTVRKRKRKKILQNINKWDISKNDYFFYLGEALPIVCVLLKFYGKIKKKGKK